MAQIRRLTTALILAAGLISCGKASAGPLDFFGCGDCPPPSYSPFRYWTPGLARLRDNCRGPKLSVYAPDRHPEIPPTVTILKFPCPAVAAGATIIEPPTPPATSRFRY